MITQWMRALLVVAAVTQGAALADEPTFLDVDDAFRMEASASQEGAPSLAFTIAPGYHLYRERLEVESGLEGLRLAPLALPPGTPKFDANFGREMALYAGHVRFDIPIAAAPAGSSAATLTVRYQGCADAGLCYPPQERALRLALDAKGRVLSVQPAAGAASREEPAPSIVAEAPATADEGLGKVLGSGRLLAIAGMFFVAGLLLSLTPCVLPMVPILASIIVGDRAAGSRRRGFTLSAAYSVGMATAYTAFGIAAGLAGEGLSAFLQNGWVLGGFALLMALLSLSMFGAYELQMPSAMQTRVSAWSARLRGGRHLPVFAMGVLSALIVGPCIAAPLAGALVYISQTRDVLVGGVALFCLAAGMSVPLLLVGMSAGSLLPRAGRWMDAIKHAMGLGLLAVSWWMLVPVVAPAVELLLLAAWFALAAALLGAFHPLSATDGLRRAVPKAAGVLCLFVSVAQVAGALSGARDPWQPLRGLVSPAIEGAVAAAPRGASFRPVETHDQIAARLDAAGPQPVLLDFYADWCTSCKELEHSTFADPRVQSRLRTMDLMRVDVTANGTAQRDILRRYGLFGPPALLVFTHRQERARVIGFQDADRFLETLDRAGVSGR